MFGIFGAAYNTNVDADTFLEAAADAIRSNGDRSWTPVDSIEDIGNRVVGSIKRRTPFVNDYRQWRRKESYYAKYADISDGAENSPLEECEWFKSEDLLEKRLNAASKTAIEFGFFKFKRYTKSELEQRFGYFAEISDNDISVNNLYLADPYYRKQSVEKQEEYIKLCISNYNFAKMAFFRIVLMYMEVLISYNILPSFSYDVFRDALTDVSRMESILKTIQEKRDQQKNQAKKLAEERKGNTATHSTKEKNAADMTQSSQTLSYDETEDNQDLLNNQEFSQYSKMFENNKQAVDNGKMFLATALAIIDGSPEFVRLLRLRDYSALNAISGATTAGKTANNHFMSDGASAKINRFIKACVGEGIIDYNELGAGLVDEPTSILKQYNARANASAASNNPKQYLMHSFYDMVVHDCRGRMLRAFPTFYMILIDEGRKIGRWKLHDNFYNINSVASITVSKSRKNPTDVAEVVMSNFYHTFSNDDEDINNNYTANYVDVFNSLWMPLITSEYAEQEEQRRKDAADVERFQLRAGARVHIRMGYGADASHLPTQLNGMVAEVETGDSVKLICQSDGAELCKPIPFDIKASEVTGIDEAVATSTWNKNGQTPKRIIRSLMNCYGGYINKKMHENNMDDIANSFSNPVNPLGIYHFGNPDWNFIGDHETMQNIFEVGVKGSEYRYTTMSDEQIKEQDKQDREDEIKKRQAARDEAEEEVPLLNFELFGKTVWDVVNICKSVEPTYYAAIVPFGMRSTLFFGRPNDYYAYDYDVSSKTLYERRKPFQQYHIYASNTDIINNNIAVSTKNMKTVAIGLYETTGFMNDKVSKKTDPQYFDAAVFPEYQKTMYVDTKLLGEPSRKLGAISDFINYFTGGVGNSWLDRAVGDTGDIRNHHSMACKMTVNALQESMKEMYTGQITVIGDPTLKPFDRVLLNDLYDVISGQCFVRDVVQVFNAEQGYKTVFTPDLIATTCGAAGEQELKTNSVGEIVSGAALSCIPAFFVYKSVNSAAEYVAKIRKSGALKKTIEFLNNAKEIGSEASSVFKSAIKAEQASEKLQEGGKIARAIFSTGKTFSSAASAEVATTGSVAAFAVAAPEIIAGIAAVGIGTFAFGSIADMIGSSINSRKRIVLFPLKKYSKPLVGGINGNTGSVYGSPNFDAKDGFQTILSKLTNTAGGKAIIGLMDIISNGASSLWETNTENGGGILTAVQKTKENATSRIADTAEGKAQAALAAVNASHLETSSNTFFNPAKPRIDVTRKDSLEFARKTYGVEGHSQDEINSDPKMKYMKLVCDDNRLKQVINLGFFRVAAHEKGFTKDISDKIKCIYIDKQDGSGYVSVNAITDSNNGSVDIPFLHSDAQGVLCAIITKAFNYMPGNEQQRDKNKWYENNKSSCITLTSALKCGSPNGYENTGFSFVLSASDDKTLKAVANAINTTNSEMKAGHSIKSIIPEAVMSYNIEGNFIYVVVYPPEDNS